MFADISEEVVFDLFKNLDQLPEKVREILDCFAEEENDYSTCHDLKASLEAVGYTIDWGLDAEPFNLKPMTPV